MGEHKMNNNPNELVTIDLMEFFAFLVRKVLIVILVCLLFSALAVSFHFVVSGSEEAREDYEYEYNNYLATISNKKNQLDVLKNKRKILNDSFQKRPVFDLYEKGNVFKYSISFYISDDDKMIILDSGDILFPSQEQLLTFFESLDLKRILDVDIDNQGLREIITLSASRNFCNLSVFQSDEVIAKKWAESIYDVILNYASGEKQWILNNRIDNSEPYSGQEIVDLVESEFIILSEYDELIVEQSSELKELELKPPKQFHFLKYAVIGFVIGGFVGILFLLFSYVRKNLLTKSLIDEKKIGLPFLGALFVSNVLDKIARKIISERKFSSETEAIEYIKGNIRNTILKDSSANNVAILCSCKSKDVEKQAKTLESVLSEFGCKTTLVTDVSVNPESADVVSSTNAVILLERQWVSQWKLVGVSMDLAKRFNKPVVGFVLC